MPSRQGGLQNAPMHCLTAFHWFSADIQHASIADECCEAEELMELTASPMIMVSKHHAYLFAGTYL